MMNMPVPSAPDVVIVGAGPTGLVLAIDLRQRGATVRVLDKLPEPLPWTRANSIQARSLEVFADLGVVDAILARGLRLRNNRVLDGDKVLVSLTWPPFDTTPYPYQLNIPQSTIETVLRARLAGLGVRVEQNMELVDLEQIDARVHARFSNSAGGREEIVAQYLVGTDGASSRVRQLLALPFTGDTYPEKMIVSDFHIDGDLPREGASIWLHDDGAVFLWPWLEPNFWHLIVNVTTEQDAAISTPTLADVQRIFNERTGRTDIHFRDPVWTSKFRIHKRHVMRYQVGRVLLAGDAAHIHSPVGGQGLNTGVQDAYNLGWKLAQVLQGKADARLLATYTRERLPIAQETLGRAEGLQNVLLAPNPLLRVVRTYALAPLVRLRPVIERVIKANAQLSVRYRRSSLASNRDRWPWRTGWRGPRAGDRAPGGPGLLAATGMQTNLFHSFRGPQWTLLLFAGRTPTAQTLTSLLQISGQAQQRLGSDVKSVLVVAGSALPARLAWEGEVVLDPTHTLHRRYGALRTGCYLVRPDKYIGLRAIPARVEAVATYLDQLVERPSPAPASSVSTLAGAA